MKFSGFSFINVRIYFVSAVVPDSKLNMSVTDCWLHKTRKSRISLGSKRTVHGTCTYL